VPPPVPAMGAGRQSGERILRALAEDLLLRGALDLEEAFIDASFSSAKKGRLCWSNAPRKRIDRVGARRHSG
jgi:hypothetical protein